MCEPLNDVVREDVREGVEECEELEELCEEGLGEERRESLPGERDESWDEVEEDLTRRNGAVLVQIYVY